MNALYVYIESVSVYSAIVWRWYNVYWTPVHLCIWARLVAATSQRVSASRGSPRARRGCVDENWAVYLRLYPRAHGATVYANQSKTAGRMRRFFLSRRHRNHRVLFVLLPASNVIQIACILSKASKFLEMFGSTTG